MKHLIKHILLGLAAVLVLSGCARPTPKLPATPPVDWPRSPEQVIFQIHTEGGLIGPLDWAANVPQLTRRVSIYAFPPELSEQEQDRAVLDRLRALRRGFLDALAESAVPYTPDSVTLLGGQHTAGRPAEPSVAVKPEIPLLH